MRLEPKGWRPKPMETTVITKKYEKDGKSASRSRNAGKFSSLQELFSYVPTKDSDVVSVSFQLSDEDKKKNLTQADKLVAFINSENERQAGILAYQEARFELMGEDTLIESETKRIMSFAEKLGKTITEAEAKSRATALVKGVSAL